MTDYNNTNINNKRCSDFQETRSDCPINGSFFPILENFYPITDALLYDLASYEVFPMLTVT